MVYRFLLFLSRWPEQDEQDAQLSQRDQTALFLANNGRLKLGDNTLQILYVCPQLLWHNQPAKLSNSAKKRKIRAITQFKVIQGHRGQYQSKARLRLTISG